MAGDEVNQAIDAVLTALGWRGRYQVTQLCQIILATIPTAFHVLSIVFIGKMNEHTCRTVDNVTSHIIPPDVTNITYRECSVTWLNVSGETVETPCPNGLQYSEPLDRSLVSEWNLVCKNTVLADLTQTLMLGGMTVGAFVFTFLADRYGRKPVHIACNMGIMIVGMATAFLPTFAAFLPLRFLMGTFQQGLTLTCGILYLELVPANQRFVLSSIGTFLWGLAMVLLAFVSFLMRSVSWRYLQILLTVFSSYSFLQIWFLDESLRWLVANGKLEKAERILKKAARLNAVNESDILHLFRTKTLGHGALVVNKADQKVDSTERSDQNSKVKQNEGTIKQELPKYSILDVCRHKQVLIASLVNGYAWFANTITYYGLSMTSVTLTYNMYLGFFLSAIMELPNALVIFLLAERCGRKKICDVFHTMSGLSLLLSVTLTSLAGDTEGVSIAVVVLSLLGKFCISCTFGILFLYTPEQFPTNLRSVTLGIACMAGRIGGMVTPFSRTLIRYYAWAPGTIFGVCCLAVPLLTRMLPETRGKELPQTLQQMAQMKKSTKSPEAVHQISMTKFSKIDKEVKE